MKQLTPPEILAKLDPEQRIAVSNVYSYGDWSVAYNINRKNSNLKFFEFDLYFHHYYHL